MLVSLDPAVDNKQLGIRPVVVISAARLNESAETRVMLPIATGGRFQRRRGFAVSLDDARTRTVGYVIQISSRPAD